MKILIIFILIQTVINLKSSTGYCWQSMVGILNSSESGDGIFWLWGSIICRSIICLLMPWLLMSPKHQQTWYWLCTTENMHCCFRVNFIYQIEDVIQNVNIDVIIFKTFQHVKRQSTWDPSTKNISISCTYPFWYWNTILSGDLGQYHGCWCPGSLRRLSSAAMILTAQDIRILVFHEELQWYTPSQFWEMVENANIFLFP